MYYIWLALGGQEPHISNPFTDVPSDWAGAPAVLWALENEVTTGKTATTFQPHAICSRGEIVTFLYRAYT